jgi:type IV secretory pathway VirB2 component (pilin)
MVGILGVVWAGLSFVLGKENARNHLILALIGVAVGFGAPSLITLIRSLVN